MPRRLDIDEENQVLTLGWTLWGRVVGGLYRAIKIFPWFLVIAVVFFLPDYIGGFTGEEPVPGMFWGSVVGLVVLGCILWGVVRVVRRQQWFFDGADRRIVAEVRWLWTSPKQGEVDLRNLEALELTTRRWPFESELAIRIDDPEADREREVVFAEPGMGDRFEEVAEAIMEFLREQRYPDVALERPDRDENDT